MRILFAICALGALALTPEAVTQAMASSDVLPAKAQTSDVQNSEDLSHEARLNKLFGELKRARSESAAKTISGRIIAELNKSGSASVDLMMGWVQKAVDDKKYDIALDFLDQITAMRPDYAEGWNRRATVHFLMNNFAKSMTDIERTLELEPRHFGALGGLAQIMKNRDRKELALAAYERVLAVYPMLRSAQNEVATLQDELTGEKI